MFLKEMLSRGLDIKHINNTFLIFLIYNTVANLTERKTVSALTLVVDICDLLEDCF